MLLSSHHPPKTRGCARSRRCRFSGVCKTPGELRELRLEDLMADDLAVFYPHPNEHLGNLGKSV